MAQRNQFEPGYKAPNNGWYIEIGETGREASITDPKIVHLAKGEPFPETTNEDRKWTRKD